MKTAIFVLASFVLILGLAATLRFASLGETDLRGDEVTLYLSMVQGVDLWAYLSQHLLAFDHDRQMPVPRVLTAFTIQTFGLAKTSFSVRAPFAAAGTATVIAFWVLGWQLALARQLRLDEYHGQQRLTFRPWTLATVLGLLVAVNPYHLYWSRTAHIYVFPMFFLAMALACSVGWYRCLQQSSEQTIEGRLWLSGVFAGSLLASYSHMSAWPAVLLLWALLIGAWYRTRSPAHLEQPHKAWPKALTVAAVVWGVFLVPWAWKFVAGLLNSTADPVWGEVSNPLNRPTAMWRVPFIMTWGGGWRSAWTLGLPIAAVALGWRHRTWGNPVRLVLGTTVGLFVLLSLAQSSGFFAVRYYTPLWVLFVLLSCIGMLLVGDRLHALFSTRGEVVGVAALVLGLLLSLVTPIDALRQLQGNPVEFTRLAETLDQQFPEGTPALVNGRNVAQIEMLPYPPQKVIPTFTVPDVGFEMWQRNRWRETAEEFLRRFPDAPLVQQGRNFYDHPQAGPWHFPESYFARRIELRNEQALTLRRTLLAASEDFYTGDPINSRAVTVISYNLPEDLVAAARADGRKVLALYGEGWRYAKTPDLADWRVLEDTARIDLYSLVEEPATVLVRLKAKAARGRKRIQVTALNPEQEITTTVSPLNEDFNWQFALEMSPGTRTIELSDALHQVGHSLLLVSSLEASLIEAQPD